MTLLPRRVHSFTAFGYNSGSDALTTIGAMGQISGSYAYHNAVNNYYEYQWRMPLEKGTYSLSIFYAKGSSSGIVSVYLNDTLLGTIDQYGGGVNYNQTYSSITVNSNDYATLKFKVLSKNASATSYGMELQCWELVRTDAGTEVGALEFSTNHVEIPSFMIGPNSAPTMTKVLVTSIALSSQIYQSSPADSQNIIYYLPLKAGTYTISARILKTTNAPIIDVSLGGSFIQQGLDLYAASGTWQVQEWSGINVASDGIYELKFTTNGKNASSSNYYFFHSYIGAKKTA